MGKNVITAERANPQGPPKKAKAPLITDEAPNLKAAPPAAAPAAPPIKDNGLYL